jgi:hypothetical protein
MLNRILVAAGTHQLLLLLVYTCQLFLSETGFLF